MTTSMTAVRVHAFGAPEVLVPERVPIPEPAPGDVLVRVHAAGLNPPDWYRRVGYANIPEPLRPPAPALPFTPGTDVSGTVAALGPGVTRWQVGDEVHGLVRFPAGSGSGYAEYTTVPADQLAAKPATVDHVRAAAVPMAGLTAYQFLVDHLKLDEGRRVLINGAAGGVGHFLVQLVRARGSRAIAVASGRHETFLRDLGVDEFIDYTVTDAAEVVRDADVVLDSVGGPHAHRLLRTLRPGGTIMPVFFGDYRPERAAELGIEIRGAQVRSDGRRLAELAGLIDAGRVVVGVDSVFPLTDAAAAHRRAERGHIQGKIVLRVS